MQSYIVGQRFKEPSMGIATPKWQVSTAGASISYTINRKRLKEERRKGRNLFVHLLDQNQILRRPNHAWLFVWVMSLVNILFVTTMKTLRLSKRQMQQKQTVMFGQSFPTLYTLHYLVCLHTIVCIKFTRSYIIPRRT